MRTILTASFVFFVCVHLRAADRVASREQIEKDLVLQVALESPATIRVGEPVEVSVVLRNQSPNTSYSVVVPGDGSEAGWREPYVFFTATLDPGNRIFKPVPAVRYSRCGLFDSNWQKDARILKPGESLALKRWLESPSKMLEFQESGRIRLLAHYSYLAGARGGGEAVTAGPMAGVPAFEVVSVPVEFDVVRPLDLVLTVKTPLTLKEKAKISDLFDIRLVNRSKQPIEVSSPTISADARLSLEIDGQFNGWRPSIDTQKTTYGEKISLKPGEEVAVLGAGSFANGLDGTWEYPVPDTVRVRAAFYASTWRTAPVILSNWTEIKVVQSKIDAP